MKKSWKNSGLMFSPLKNSLELIKFKDLSCFCKEEYVWLSVTEIEIFLWS